MFCINSKRSSEKSSEKSQRIRGNLLPTHLPPSAQMTKKTKLDSPLRCKLNNNETGSPPGHFGNKNTLSKDYKLKGVTIGCQPIHAKHHVECRHIGIRAHTRALRERGNREGDDTVVVVWLTVGDSGERERKSRWLAREGDRHDRLAPNVPIKV